MVDVGLTPRRIGRARNGDLLVFALNGFLLASWTSRIPDIKSMLSLSAGQLSWLLLAISAGSVIGLPLAGRVAHRIGAASTVRIGFACVLPGMLLAAGAVQAHNPALAVPGLVLVGLGNGVWDVSQNLEGTRIEMALGRAIMPWFHAAFSGGTVIAALIGAGLTALHVPLIAHIGTVVVLSIGGLVWGTVGFLPTVGEADPDAPAAKAPKARSAWLEPRTLLIGVIVLAAAFAEGTANDWLAVAFVDGHHLANALGVVAFSVFLVFMTAGRILGTNLLDRYGRVVVLRILFGMAIVGCLLVVFGPTWLAFVGAAICGVGASLGFPVGMSAASDDPERAPLRLSVVSTIGYLAFLGGPPLLGFLGDHMGVLRALLVVGAMSVIAIFIVPIAKPLTRRTAE